MINVQTSKEYKKGLTILDEKTKEVFKVLSCKRVGGMYSLELELIRKNNDASEAITQLVEALEGTKMHDKDLFMLLNMVSVLDDIINE